MNLKTKKESGAMRTIVYHIVAIVTAMIWGITFVNTRKLMDGGLKPEDIFVLRFFIAYICIWFISPQKLFADSWKDEFLMFLLGVFGGSLYFCTENWAIKYSFVNNVSFIVSIAPLITVMIALMIYKNVKASWLLTIGSAMAVLGVGFVIYNGQFNLKLNPLGDLLALAAAVSWAFYSLLMKNVSGRYSSVFLTRKVFFYGVLSILPIYIVNPWTFPLSGFLDVNIWGNLFFLGCIASFVCFVSWTWVIVKLGALKSSNYIYLSPVTTVLASALFLDEPMTLMAFVGCALILLGVFVANKAKGI
ncbi:DMT family transporter [Prevotella sp. HUN102]|uniref:DMT family transporter n=1 Tax=Prevotella sp. HUN102 TaxID=1392486 RepID=UPI0009DCF0CD|nr:DMT family transporter [Prevotella sp. HUN102]